MDTSVKTVEEGCKLLNSNPQRGEVLIKEGLKADPNNAIYWYNLAIAKHQNKKIKPAIDCYRKAIGLNHSERVNRMANNNLAQELLLNGEWEEGWQRYMERYELEKDLFRVYIELYGNAWTGFKDKRNLKKLIVVGEQGYGDSIQFVRFIDELHKKGIETTFYGPEFLKTLFKTQMKFGHMSTMLKTRAAINTLVSVNEFATYFRS